MKSYMENYDLRRMRAQRLTGAIMQEVGPLLEGDNRREVNNAIYELLWRTGADLITDSDRQAAGLPDRGNLGYTADELRILEAR